MKMMMEKTTPTVKPPGLTNDFSEQEQTMTASAMPPAFALTASAAADEGSDSNDRNAVPFEGFGGDVALDAECTTTVLGRCVEGATKEEMVRNVDQPLGTNYFRYQPEAMVGKNKGGLNVLDVADRTWTWPLNNAWLQAAVDRGDRIRFISDPADMTTLHREGVPGKGLTVTGMELGVLMNRGHAPDEKTGLVQKGYQPNDADLAERWEEIRKEVVEKGQLGAVDMEAYLHFLNGAQAPARTPKEYKAPSGDIMAVQTNFFGCVPSAKA